MDSLNIDIIREMPVLVLCEMILEGRDDKWFWYLSGFLMAKIQQLDQENELAIQLWDCGHEDPPDMEKGRAIVREVQRRFDGLQGV